MPQSGFSTKTGPFRQPSKTTGNGKSPASAAEEMEARDRDFLMNRILPRIGTAKQKAEDARSDLGVIFQEVEDRGHHRGALKLCLKLQAMEEEKRTDYLRAFFKYGTWFGFGDQLDLLDPAWPVPHPSAAVQVGHAGAKPAAAPDGLIDEIDRHRHRQDAENVVTPSDGALSQAQRIALSYLAAGACRVREFESADNEGFHVMPPGDPNEHAGVDLSRVEWSDLILKDLVERVGETAEWTATEAGRAAAAPAAAGDEGGEGSEGEGAPLLDPAAGSAAFVVERIGAAWPKSGVSPTAWQALTRLAGGRLGDRDGHSSLVVRDGPATFVVDDAEVGRLIEAGVLHASGIKLTATGETLVAGPMPRAEKDAADSQAAYRRVQRGRGSRKRGTAPDLAAAGSKPAEAEEIAPA